VASWRDYQEEVAVFFRTLGLTADTDVTLQGVRTSHDVDVVVNSRHAGFEVLWLVECKAWKSAVPKEKVLALRSIVDDVGADRGFIMAEGGYQSGALQAARFANVVLTSLADLRETLAYEVGIASLSSLDARIGRCRDRYWAIDKQDRIDLGLRPDVGASGFMGDALLKAVEHTLRQALLRGFPVVYDRAYAALSAHAGGAFDPVDPDDDHAIETPAHLFAILDGELRELETRLDAAEEALRRSH
jgi:restriction system protein